MLNGNAGDGGGNIHQVLLKYFILQKKTEKKRIILNLLSIYSMISTCWEMLQPQMLTINSSNKTENIKLLNGSRNNIYRINKN
jgi:hypothetical protein